MTLLNFDNWSQRLSNIDFAFQPIVNTHTGACYGYEAFLRNYNAFGFRSVKEFLDQAYTDNMLPQLELAVQKKAIRKFSALLKQKEMKLFINLDRRNPDAKEYKPEKTLALLKQYELSPDNICFEISGKSSLWESEEMVAVLKNYRSHGFKIAIDGYGMGFSNLRTLYYSEPDFIKIDRFFIQDIEKDSKKKLFVSNIIDVAHYLGSVVIAAGMEKKEEYFILRDIGCDMIQGFLVQRPETKPSFLREQYRNIALLNQSARGRQTDENNSLIAGEIEKIETVSHGTDIAEIFKRFKEKREITFLPVIGTNGEPLGIIREKSFKNYTYSRYGNELLQNPAFGKNIDKFISKFPVADIHSPTEKILENFSRDENIEGILMVDNMKYVGFLSASSLLKSLNEKNLAAASDQNPLSKLPGSTLVYEYISAALRDMKSSYMFVYFDFDNFKFYNDKYGFREGDRVILLFSELLKKTVSSPDHFAGHIGGDDFFMGIRETSLIKIRLEVKQLLEVFHRNVESFYDPASIKKGYIISWLPDKKVVNIPLLTARAVLLELPVSRFRFLSLKEIADIAEKHSKEAKDNPDKLCSVCLGDIHKHLESQGKENFPILPASGRILSSGLVNPAVI